MFSDGLAAAAVRALLSQYSATVTLRELSTLRLPSLETGCAEMRALRVCQAVVEHDWEHWPTHLSALQHSESSTVEAVFRLDRVCAPTVTHLSHSPTVVLFPRTQQGHGLACAVKTVGARD